MLTWVRALLDGMAAVARAALDRAGCAAEMGAAAAGYPELCDAPEYVLQR